VRDYQCVLVGDVWHLTQEQASPPPITRGGAYVLCPLSCWADFKRGYERRRPTCAQCLAACIADEGEPVPMAVRKPRTLAVQETFNASYGAVRKPRSLP
jgi:hypothetical protein